MDALVDSVAGWLQAASNKASIPTAKRIGLPILNPPSRIP
jgi:hypothetical protein